MHWNKTVFRFGEQGDGVDHDGSDLTPEEEELRKLAKVDALAAAETEFGDMVREVERVCKPPMAQREAEIRDRKIKRLNASQGKAGVTNNDSPEY